MLTQFRAPNRGDCLTLLIGLEPLGHHPTPPTAASENGGSRKTIGGGGGRRSGGHPTPGLYENRPAATGGDKG